MSGDRREEPAVRGLEVRGLEVAYDGVVVLPGLDLDVDPGEVVAVLGPSGCGKSTLLRAVAGLEPAVSGSLHWAGRDLGGVPVHRRGFGLVFQDGQLFAHRDVGGNVAYGLRIAGLGRAERRDRVVELLATVGLEGYAPRPVTSLSGGERQRVALARALAPRPALLLLDEPLSALDRALRERLALDLRAILTSTGTTALHVTHDHDEAFTVADRVAVMTSGRLRQVGAPAQVWGSPADDEVATFLGWTAVVEPEVVGAGPGGRVGLRAESLQVVRESAGPTPGGPTLGGTVEQVTARRGGLALEVRLERGEVVPASASLLDRVSVDEQVRLRLDPSAIARLPT